MKAVLIDRITPGTDITISDIVMPVVRPGWVLIRVRAFGLNHSEKILRFAEIENDYITKPVVPGIECAGEIADASDSDFHIGERVIAIMGGMGRSFNGGYAEYVLVPVMNVFRVGCDMDWEYIAAAAETYFTAWGALFESLQIKPDDTLLIRGATCALGYAVMQIARALGCKIIATTHRADKLPLIADADTEILDNGEIAHTVNGATKALDLVGAKYLRDTLRAVEKGGIVCNTGILGGVFALDNFDPIKEIPNGVYLTGFFSNYPRQNTIDDIFAFLRKHNLTPRIGRVFDFADIRDAVIAQDNGSVDGKIVVKIK